MAEQERQPEEKKATHLVAKVIATVFGAVIAPVLVAVGVKWADPDIWKGKPPPPTPTTETASTLSTPPLPLGPVRPGDVIHLLGPKLGERFYSIGWSPKKEDNVRDDAVDPGLFAYDAATGTLQAPGKYSGKLITKKAYANYLLTIEYKWGSKTYGTREGKARQASLFVHASDKDPRTVRPCILVTVHEGGWPGNWALGLIPTDEMVTAVGKVKERWKTPPGKGGKGEFFCQVYDPSAPPVKLTNGGKAPAGYLDLHPWGGYVYQRYQDVKMASREDTLGLHPPGDPAIPNEWNKVEVACYGKAITLYVNGKEVNALTNLSLSSGLIAFDTNGAEIAIRRFDVEPPKKH